MMPDTTLHILLVEDDSAHVALIRRAFEGRGEALLTVAGTLQEARAAAARRPPDIAVIDLLLPDGKGTEILPEEGMAYPVVIMTSHGDEQVAVEAMKAGALDYVVKSAGTLLELPYLVERSLREWRHIQERQQAEALLRESEERFRQVVSSISDHIYMEEITNDGRFLTLYLSPNFEDLTGYSAAAMVDGRRVWLDLVHEEDRERVEAHLRQLRVGEDSEVEYRLMQAGGTAVWVRDNARVKEEGEKRRVYGVVSDITERKQIESELARYRNRLEDLVEKRTEELESAKRTAEAANRAKSEFLSNVSHELRTPLNGILGYAQILKREKSLDPPQVEWIDVIQESGQHLLMLINDILDLSRIEAQRMELYPNDIYLPGFLRDIVSIVRVRAQQKGLHFRYEIEGPLPEGVTVDGKRLRQVLINLLDNAVKFTDEGEVLFQVQSEATETEARLFRFSVADSGQGMSAAQLEKIFQPFAQVGSLRQRSEGTGLGLAISSDLVKMMGSRLHVVSRAGEGSRFWFEMALPVVLMRRDRVETAVPIGYKGERRHALIIDDEKQNRRFLSELLGAVGFEVSRAERGREGIALAQAFPPDVILLDLVMPGLSGYETARALRQDARLHEVVIIAVSASVYDNAKEESQAAGCDDFLSKPIRADDLFALLETYLQLEWRYDEEEMAPPPMKTVTAPPPEHLQTLLDLALRGNMSGIRREAAKIRRDNAAYADFAHHLDQLARGYEEQEILALLQRYV